MGATSWVPSRFVPEHRERGIRWPSNLRRSKVPMVFRYLTGFWWFGKVRSGKAVNSHLRVGRDSGVGLGDSLLIPQSPSASTLIDISS